MSEGARMAHIETLRCFWCKRLLWGEGDKGPERRCSCVGYGRRRFHMKVCARRSTMSGVT